MTTRSATEHDDLQQKSRLSKQSDAAPDVNQQSEDVVSSAMDKEQKSSSPETLSTAAAVAVATAHSMQHTHAVKNATVTSSSNYYYYSNGGTTTHQPFQAQHLLRNYGQGVFLLPANQINNNITNSTYNQTHSVSPTTSTSDIFKGMILRRGKWTQEEEQYASLLIEEFEKGSVTDCENGSTLRAYLSRKLHCAPMRISKKFAGKSIGKHVFLFRAATDSSINGSGFVRLPDNSEKLRQFEFLFHMSLLQENNGGSDINDPKAVLMGPGNYPAFALPFALTSLSQHNQAAQQGFMNNYALPPNQANLSQAQIQPMAAQQGTFFNQGILPQPARSENSGGACSTSEFDPLKQLRETFLNAFGQSYGINVHAGQRENPEVNVTATNTDLTNVSSQLASKSALANEQSSAQMAASSFSNPSSMNSVVNPPNQSCLSPNGNTEISTSVVNNSLDNNIKDESNKVISVTSEESHSQLWQKDQEPKEKPAQNLSGINLHQFVNMFPQPATLERQDSDIADAYAIFAQQSAFAVSQHSAYCRNDLFMPPDVYNKKSPDFDVDCISARNHHNHHHELVAQSELAVEPKTTEISAFNAANLQAHLKASEEKVKAAKQRRNSSPLPNKRQRPNCAKETNLTTNFLTPLSFDQRHSRIVSESERSSDMGTESESLLDSSQVSANGSGSDNFSDSVSDNSDSASDGGQSSSGKEGVRKTSINRTTLNDQAIGGSTLLRKRTTHLSHQ